jgi:DNA repair protein RadA/Sms
VPPDAVVFGEIGLAGEVRAVSQTDARLKEAAKLGFARAFVPASRRRERTGDGAITVVAITDLGTLVTRLSGGRSAGGRGATEKAETRT